jgi:glycosyltransferase involved in cell wall biosynthesis
MDVTVVIPTRDRPELLALTLRSVLRQEHVKAEVLVIDDGAGRGTQRVLDGLRNAPIQLLRNVGPPGVGGARNTGVAHAKGEWISFLDDDDLWAPTKLASQLAACQQTGAWWVYAGHVTVDEALCVRDFARPARPQEVVDQLSKYNSVPAGASNVAVRRDVLAKIGGFDPALRTSEDWDLWLRLAATGLPACVSRPLVALRSHPRMVSRDVNRMLADIEVIATRHCIPIDRARHQRWAAWMCLEEGRRAAALRHYILAAAAGDFTSLGRAAVAVAYSPVAHAHRRSPPRDDWGREAQAWLDVLRAEANDVCSSEEPRRGRDRTDIVRGRD